MVRGPYLDEAAFRGIADRSVDAFRVVVLDVFPEQPSQVLLTYNDHMIE
jgi:hypothetical protein